MTGILLIRDLQEQGHRLLRDHGRLNVGGGGQCTQAFIIEHRQLIEGDGHVAGQCCLRSRHDLTRKADSL